MRSRRACTPVGSKVVSVAGFFLLCLVPATLASPPNDACSIPQDLQRGIAIKYPGARPVNLPDLAQDDRGFFQKDHGNACPGLVKVDFYGDGNPTFAVVLVVKSRAKNHTQLIVAHEVAAAWNILPLDKGDASLYAPVVWSQPPGRYTDIDNGKTIRAANPVIIFCKYESWAIVYAWTGKNVAKVWIED
jgi:hypothetical protein